VAPLLLAAGCGASDPCAGHDGTCIALTVDGPGQVDQLAVHLSGAAALDAVTPPDGPAAPRALPVETAIYLPPVTGRVTVDAVGLRAGGAVGEGSGVVDLTPGAHAALSIALGAALADGAAPPDLASAIDSAGAIDQANATDLATPIDRATPVDQATSIDQATAVDQASAIDLAEPPDLVPPPRLVFLAPARAGDFGDLAGADTACMAATAGTAWQGRTFRALLADTGGTAPASRIDLTAGRTIVLPDGQPVATDATFFANSHLRAIAETIDGAVTGIGCAWTNFLPDGSLANQADCGAWSTQANLSGAFGRTGNTDAQWASAGGSSSCATLCHLYCIEQ
jgi:hypothetical protein